jgi:hypothetical protein
MGPFAIQTQVLHHLGVIGFRLLISDQLALSFPSMSIDTQQTQNVFKNLTYVNLLKKIKQDCNILKLVYNLLITF